MRIRLALDAGQTGVKVRVIDTGQAWTLPGVRTNADLVPQLAEVVRDAADRLAGPVIEASVGSTGLTGEDTAARLLGLCAGAGTQRVWLAHDSVTSYLGALGLRTGVVVAAGTGVVTLGVGAGTVARVDGWGNIMGDAGSGYWIGRAALDAVMRAHDGRGPATALTPVVTRSWPDLESAYIDLQTDPDRIRVVARFAKEVCDLSDVDAVAAGICRQAGAELALAASAAIRRCDLGTGAAVCGTGSIFRSRAVRASFLDHLRSSDPDARIVEPVGEGIDGAGLLSQAGSVGALSRWVDTAG